MQTPQETENVIVVLSEPKDPVNIGGVVRAMKNMGLGRLHLVRAENFAPRRIEGVAHTGMDIIRSAGIFDRLEDAVAGAGLVVGTTARGRRVRRSYRRPREATEEILNVAAEQDVALVFGREDRGLSNHDLDLCNRIIVIPTHPEHASLNLAQAVMIVAYEILMATEAQLSFKTPRRSVPRAQADDLELLATEVEASLHAIDFFKSHKVVSIMRTVREVAGRAELDRNEAALLKAMAIEVRKFLARAR